MDSAERPPVPAGPVIGYLVLDVATGRTHNGITRAASYQTAQSVLRMALRDRPQINYQIVACVAMSATGV